MPEKETPMIRQYRRIKNANRDKILFFRVGDFYEMFFHDAEIAARELEITLTSRETGKDNHVPLAGVPYHAAETYISRLIEKGYKVAICEQVEDPQQAKGLVKRAVVRVITPGTLVEQAMLREKENNFLLALASFRGTWSAATVGVSTAELMAAAFDTREKALEELHRMGPAECLVPEDIKGDPALEQSRALVNYLPGNYFSLLKGEKAVLDHFESFSLEGLGLADFPAVTCSVGGLLTYLKGNSGDVGHIKRIRLYHPEEFMLMDSITRKNLELTTTIREGKRFGSLLWVLDRTHTSMGGRLLKRWIEQPLINRDKILKRQDAVEELGNNIPLKRSIRENIGDAYDLERLISRINMGTCSPRDLVALKNTLKLLPPIREALLKARESLQELGVRITLQENLVSKLEEAMADAPPATLKEGGIIREGFNRELDELRGITRDSRRWLADFESKERERTGIRSLKVRYNKVFGYYIEITRANLTMAPADYIRKQTLVNAERFISQALKEREEIILRAEEQIKELENRLFQDLRREIAQKTWDIQEAAEILAQLDCLLSLALVSEEFGYRKPSLTQRDGINIQGGRHPVVEQVLSDRFFVENDLFLGKDQRIILLTGPNMAGKSTYLRQSALLVLMAQMGCFIPARKATIGIVDRIFTRVGAADDLVGGQSTFMVEMNEVANILKNSTRESLVILDEVGRGTSTYDGISIAWAATNYIHKHIQAKTLFATHYHELTALEERLPDLKNFNIAVKERGEEVVFLRKVIPGAASRSYGIQVARLAGLPRELIEEATHMLKAMEAERLAHPPRGKGPLQVVPAVGERQLSIFPLAGPTGAEKRILGIDLMTSTPLEVMQVVHEIQQALQKNGREKEDGNEQDQGFGQTDIQSDRRR